MDDNERLEKIEKMRSNLNRNISTIKREIRSGKLSDSEQRETEDLLEEMENVADISDMKTFYYAYKKVGAKIGRRAVGKFVSFLFD